jgi:DNA-directed RNA polymerase specialized sigma24 family protein
MARAWIVRFKSNYRDLLSIDDADDIAQETLMIAFSKIDGVEIEKSWVGWLYLTTVNQALTFCRDRKEIPASQLTKLDDEGTKESAEDYLARLGASSPEPDLDGSVLAERYAHEDQVSAELDRFRETLSETDQTLFDALRQEHNSGHKVSLSLGKSREYSHGRLSAWKHRVAGTRPPEPNHSQLSKANRKKRVDARNARGLIKRHQDKAARCRAKFSKFQSVVKPGIETKLLELIMAGVNQYHAAKSLGRARCWTGERIMTWKRRLAAKAGSMEVAA